jgi:hypothetical protein
MRRIILEAALFTAGIVAVLAALLSDVVFNAGLALPVGILVLAVAFVLGVTDRPFAPGKPWWRKSIVAAELVCTVAAALYCFGPFLF